MAARTIEREIVIDAPVDVVWTVLTEPEHIEAWFTETARLEARPGASGELGFRRASGERNNSLLVEFTLVSEGQRTRLNLVESGFDRPQHASQREDHELGWDVCLASLVRYAPSQSDAGASQ
jgi:uncharacterized protein YndB with AHSA1/START domain